MDINQYLDMMVKENASDLYLTTGAPIEMRVEGKITVAGQKNLPSGATRDIANQFMDEQQQKAFEKDLEMNLALSLTDIGRFRINIFQQRGEVGLVIRQIKSVIPNVDEIGLPQVVKDLVMQKRGLLLVVGATGTGKSTTLASLLDYRNSRRADHIITIEDPIEFIHPHKKSIVNQREVGFDTHSYDDALKNALRQAPDVIQVGEIRSSSTMEHAIAYSETGHLCVSTLHANNANQSLERIINFFPEERHNQILLDLSLNLIGIISQRLIPGTDGTRALALEILLASPLIRDQIKKGDINSLKETMDKSTNLGMQTFDESLYQLYTTGTISLEDALANADSENNLRIKISLDEEDPSEKADKFGMADDNAYKKTNIDFVIKNS